MPDLDLAPNGELVDVPLTIKDIELSVEGSLIAPPLALILDFTWTGGDGLWSTASNWVGGSVPGSGDTARFTNYSSADCTIDVAVDVSAFAIVGYTGTVTQSLFSLNVAGDFTVVSGSFVGSAGTLSIGGDLLITGGSFTAPSGTLELNAGINISGAGVYVHNSGKVSFVGVGGADTITMLGSTLHDFDLNKTGSAAFTVTGTLLVENNFTITDSGATEVSMTSDSLLVVDGAVVMGAVPYAGNMQMLLRGVSNFTPATTWTNTGSLVISDEAYPLAGNFYMLREDGFYMLREDGFRILREGI